MVIGRVTEGRGCGLDVWKDGWLKGEKEGAGLNRKNGVNWKTEYSIFDI